MSEWENVGKIQGEKGEKGDTGDSYIVSYSDQHIEYLNGLTFIFFRARVEKIAMEEYGNIYKSSESVTLDYPEGVTLGGSPTVMVDVGNRNYWASRAGGGENNVSVSLFTATSGGVE